MRESTTESLGGLTEIRHRIDETDAILLTAFAERERLVRQAARLKLAANAELFDYVREQEVLAGARLLGVSAHNFLNHVLALTRLAIYDEIERHHKSEVKTDGIS